MENTNSKIITLSFMVAGILAWIVANVLVSAGAAMSTGALGRWLSSDLATHVIPVILGGIVFAALQFNRKVVGWADEVVTEIRKVVWPSRKDTTAMTIVVCVMLLIAGVVVGGFDIISAYAVDALLNLRLTL